MKKPSTAPSRPLTAAWDRGPARHFYGRKQILRDFSELTERATQADSGTIFLIQGAPGAGKSALLAECEKHAREHKWDVADIGAGSLWDPYKLLDSLGLGDKYELAEKSTQIGVKNLLGRGYKSTRSQPTVKNVLKDGNRPLLLVLDEAQVLGKEAVPPTDQRSNTVEVLEAIHNGKLGRPVTLLAAGLGTTVESFRSFGISRFAKRCLVKLGALGKEDERAVIGDWLKKDGGAKGDPTAWIDAIARETHGWPQHILSYVDPAVDQLDADGGVMTAEGLNSVLEAGRQDRSAYYKGRLHGFPEEERQSLVEPFAGVPLGESTTRSTIMSSLTQEYSQEEAEKLFRRALHRGILDERDGRYVIPIPSMHSWLVSRYART